MGFVDGLGRLISGKPVFENSDNVSQSSNISKNPNYGPKCIPKVYIVRIEYYEHNKEMTINAHIKNESNLELYVDKLSIFGNTKDLATDLKPGEMREFTNIYKGNRPTDRNYKYCELEYRTLQGDHFKTVHVINYKPASNNTYGVDSIKFAPPVRDINGNA